jgi:hypothetical protein
MAPWSASLTTIQMELVEMTFLENAGLVGKTGNFPDYIKYDARAGRFSRADRVQVDGEYRTELEDITTTFRAVVDLENIMVGPQKYAAGQAPQRKLVRYGQPVPECPDETWKTGVRFLMKLDNHCGGDIRELSGNSKALLAGVGELYDAYDKEKAAHPGKLPEVMLKKTIAVTTGKGSSRSTNYQPKFEIVNWKARPAELSGDALNDEVPFNL